MTSETRVNRLDERIATPNVEFVTSARRRVSWGGIFGGVMVALAVQLLLAMLGIGFGLSLVSPGQASSPDAGSFGLGAGLWWGISYLIALFAGGYIAARLAGRVLSWDGVLHGVLIWAFTLLITIYLLGTAVGSVLGGAFNIVGSTLSGAGQTLKSALPQSAQIASPDRIRQIAHDLITGQPTANADPKTMSRDQAEQEIAANLPKIAAGGDQAAQARDRIVAIMAAQLNVSPDEARSRLDQLQQQFSQTAQQVTGTAQQAADKAATGLSRASFAAFVALLLGAIAAGLGGHVGASRSDELEPGAA